MKVGQIYVGIETGLERKVLSIDEEKQKVVVSCWSPLFGTLYVDWKISDLLSASKLKEEEK